FKKKSKLFLPKDEFETQIEYAERQKKAEQFMKELSEKYKKIREQEVLASYQNKCLGIDKLSTYNAENQTFDITAVGKTQTKLQKSRRERQMQSPSPYPQTAHIEQACQQKKC
ncbi:MAG: hypothetical protein EAZ95_07315, partial [Bacteroidetes bacterium]